MKLKSILAALLIAFAVGSAAYVSLRTPPAREPAESPQSAPIMVYFFDSAVQCEACERIERFSHEVVSKKFSQELESGRIGWAKLDMDAPENAHFVEEFGLFTKSVVLVHYGEDGEILAWKDLDKIWDLVWNRPVFNRYIEDELQAFLAEVS